MEDRDDGACVGGRRGGVGVFDQHYLDRLAARGCGDPDCGHQHDVMAMTLAPGCHPDSGVHVTYRFGEGLARLYCVECGDQIAALGIIPRSLSHPPAEE